MRVREGKKIEGKGGQRKYCRAHLGNAAAHQLWGDGLAVRARFGWVFQIQLFPTHKWREDGIWGWIELNI